MKKGKPKLEEFDRQFDEGKTEIDFSEGITTPGLSQLIKLPPMSIPAWLALEVEQLAKRQANSRTAVIRQLLVEAIEHRQALYSS